MVAIALGFTIGGLLPAWLFGRYVRRQRALRVYRRFESVWG